MSHVSAQGLVNLTNCQGTDFRETTISCWRVISCWRSAHAAILYWAPSFSQDASMSPRLRPSLNILSNLARGLMIPLRGAAIRFPTLPIGLILEYSPRFECVTWRNQGTQRRIFNFTLCDEPSELFRLPARKARPDLRNAASVCCGNFQMGTHASLVWHQVSNFARQLSQCASAQPKFGMSMMFLCVQNVTCFCVICAIVIPPDTAELARKRM